MNIKIDKNIPFNPIEIIKKEALFPFDEMEVGDSFKFKTNKKVLLTATYALNAKLKGKRKFSVKKLDTGEDGNVTYRCWRIK